MRAAAFPCTLLSIERMLTAYRRVGQSERRFPPAPIRTLERSSHQGGQKMNTIHTAVRHNWTPTPSRNIVQKAVFFLMHRVEQLICERIHISRTNWIQVSNVHFLNPLVSVIYAASALIWLIRVKTHEMKSLGHSHLFLRTLMWTYSFAIPN